MSLNVLQEIYLRKMKLILMKKILLMISFRWMILHQMIVKFLEKIFATVKTRKSSLS